MTHHATWDAVLKVLATRFSLPEFRHSSKATNGQKAIGIGYLSSVRAFYEAIGVQFAAESWQGIESQQPKIEEKNDETIIEIG